MLLSLVAVEAGLQCAAFLGWLPNLNIAARVPYGRVYWTMEGFGNSVMNRYGWYVPDFKLLPGSRRIVLIGDSYIEGLQVQPDRNIGVVLERLLAGDRAGSDPPTEVLSIGISGAGPAQYVELVKYAIDFLSPSEIVVFVTLSNDFHDVLMANPDLPPERYIYYRLNERGEVVLEPRSAIAQRALADSLRRNREPLLTNFRSTLGSHYLTPKVWGAIAHAGEPDDTPPRGSSNGHETNQPPPAPWFIGAERAAVFKRERPEEVKKATRIVKTLLLRDRDLALSRGIAFRLVTIPHFPGEFYNRRDSGPWTPELGEYDLFLPERDLQTFAAEEHIPILAMGSTMRAAGLSKSEIRELFFYQGIGHFTPAGHAFFASALKSAFYPQRPR